MITTLLAEKAVEFVLGKALDRLLREAAPEIRRLEERIVEIDEKIERLLATHLKAALTFLRLEEFEKARNELVIAEANEPFAPVTKFWLAAILWHEGRRDVASEKCIEAMLLNPFVLFGKESDLPQLFVDPPPARLEKSVRLNDKTFIGTLPKRTWLGFGYPSSGAYVRRVSCSGPHPIVQWDIERGSGPATPNVEGPITGGGSYSFVSAFNEITAEVLWHSPSSKRQLCYATPRIVVMAVEEESRYELMSVIDGKRVATMGKPYYETVFFRSDAGSSLSLFRTSNIEMLSARAGSEQCLKKAGPGWPGYAKTADVSFEDDGIAENPFGNPLVQAKAKNTWALNRFGGAYNTAPHSSLKVSADLFFLRSVTP